tara:strand:- start:9281 stop:10945 length:1665 start_codon:yes stop_codon:yes gene_type:complete
MLNLVEFLKTNKFQSFWIITASLLINLLALSGALYVIQVFNKYLNYKQDTTLLALTLGVLIAFLLEFFLRIIRSYLLNKTTNLNLKNFSKKIVRKLVSIKLNSSQNVNEKIFSKINPIDNNDLNAGETLVAFIDILFIIIFLLVISLLSLNLGIISFILALIFTLLIFSKIKIKNYLNKKLLYLSEKTYSTINDIKKIPLTLRAFNASDFLINRFRLHYARQRERQKSLKNLLGIYFTLGIMFPVFSTILIIFYGSQEVNSGLLTVGALVGINILNSRLYGPINRFSIFANLTEKNETENFLKKNTDFIKYENYNGVSPKIFKGNITLNDLSLGFDQNKNILFQRLNCTMPAGSITVINGFNSSGKTSLCNSLLGLIQPIRGNILFDNIDIKNYNIKNLRRHISFVPQEIELFNLSLKENIKVNLDNKSLNINNDGFLLKIIQMVGLEGYINNLNAGLDTVVEDNGKNIPRGIKKRIAIARALITEGKIVILDEPTSSLDIEGIKKLYKILNDLRALNKTIIIASHDQNILKSAGIIIDLSVKPIPRIGVRKKK